MRIFQNKLGTLKVSVVRDRSAWCCKAEASNGTTCLRYPSAKTHKTKRAAEAELATIWPNGKSVLFDFPFTEITGSQP